MLSLQRSADETTSKITSLIAPQTTGKPLHGIKAAVGIDSCASIGEKIYHGGTDGTEKLNREEKFESGSSRSFFSVSSVVILLPPPRYHPTHEFPTMPIGNKVLSKMLDRLLAGLMSGPNMNCRPHKSRQRVDLTQLIKLQDISAEEILAGLLGRRQMFQDAGKSKTAKKNRKHESPQQKAWLDQSALLTKLQSLIADDARTYENDTGVHALSIGFPILSLPPGSFAGNSRNSTKRILAPIAFIPVNVQLKGGSSPQRRNYLPRRRSRPRDAQHRAD